MIEQFANIFDLITQVTSGEAPGWMYLVIFFIPFCILIAIREAYCWFNKVNTVVSRLDRLDKRLRDLQNAILELSQSISKQPTRPVPTQQAPYQTAGINAVDLLANTSTAHTVTHTQQRNKANQLHEKNGKDKATHEVDETGEFYLDKDWTNK